MAMIDLEASWSRAGRNQGTSVCECGQRLIVAYQDDPEGEGSLRPSVVVVSRLLAPFGPALGQFGLGFTHEFDRAARSEAKAT